MSPAVAFKKRSDAQECPTCPQCKCRMIVVKITCKADWEEWLYRCPGCGEEKIITVGPLE